MLEFMLHLRFRIGDYARLREGSALTHGGMNSLVTNDHPPFHTGLPDGPKSYRTKLTKDNSVTLELWSIPADQDSAKVKYNFRIVSGTETPQEILHWTNDLTNQVFPGLGLDQPNSGPGQKAILQTLTTGNAFQIVKVTTEHQAQLVRLF